MKTIKKSMYVLLSLMIALSVMLTGCTDKKTNDSATTDNRKFCMWEVTSKDSKGKLYLFGSMHYGDKSLYPLPSKATDAYDECDCIAVEVNAIVTDDNVSYYGATYADGTSFADHYGNDIYEKLKKMLVDNHKYIPQLDYMIPNVWMAEIDQIVMSKSGLSRDYGIDTYFIKSAEKDNKEILEVESAEFQAQLSSKFSSDFTDYDIKTYANTSIEDKVKSMLEEYEIYMAGDMDALMSRDDADETVELTKDEKEALERYYQVMLTDRNANMVEKAEQYLKENRKCFYVVGAAHMGGDDGMVELLKKKGYTVTRK